MVPKPEITPELISLKYDFFLKSSLSKILEICISIKGIDVLRKVSLRAILVCVNGPGFISINLTESFLASCILFIISCSAFDCIKLIVILLSLAKTFRAFSISDKLSLP